MITKPKLVRNYMLDGKVVGAVMLDNIGYFYRPKRGSSILKGVRSEKWDGGYFTEFRYCIKSLEV